MEITNTFYAPDRAAWRAWLEAHHATETEIWLVGYKKHTGVPSVPYDDAVEEALCFGWIDSTMKRIDDERHAQRYTPRKNMTNWSDLNKWRVGRMIAAGKMTPAGLATVTFPLDAIPSERPVRRHGKLVIPERVEAALRADAQAWEAFERLSPSEKRRYIGWISSAKREATQDRRIAEAIAVLREGKPLGMK